MIEGKWGRGILWGSVEGGVVLGVWDLKDGCKDIKEEILGGRVSSVRVSRWEEFGKFKE